MVMQPRLLVIDDDRDQADIVADVAARAGYEVAQAIQARDGLRRVAEWRPDVIVTDLQMPGVDGIALMRTLSAQRTRAKIVVVSGIEAKLIDVIVTLARERGLDIAASFVKPYALADLAGCLQRLKGHGPIAAVDLAGALRAGDIHCHLQPKCDLRTGRLLGVEALARWTDPIRGEIAPDEFLPIVERHGFADALFDRVLQAAFEGLSGLPRDITLAVNMSATNVANLSLPDRVRAICERCDRSPELLTLELTETASMNETMDGLDVLARLRLMGCALSIDDFGTGFSSLARLRALPFTEIKIDRMFIRDVAASRDAAVIVRTTLALAAGMDLAAVAEGVESAAISEELSRMGYTQGQGFGLGRPMAAHDLRDWFAASRLRHG